MPARKKSLTGNAQALQTMSHLNSIPDNKVYVFEKNEIVWAKMKFYSAWPAKVCDLDNLGQIKDDLSLDYLMMGFAP